MRPIAQLIFVTNLNWGLHVEKHFVYLHKFVSSNLIKQSSFPVVLLMQLALGVTISVLLKSLCLLTVVVCTSFEVALEWRGRRLSASLDVVAVGAGPTFLARPSAVILARASAVVALYSLIPGSKGALSAVIVTCCRRCGAELLELDVDVVELLLSLVAFGCRCLQFPRLEGGVFACRELREVFFCHLCPGGGKCSRTLHFRLTSWCWLLGWDVGGG
jgi:hypothetical protein